MTNSEDRDDMLHKVAFYWVMHSLRRQNQSSEKEMYHNCNHSIYKIDHPDLNELNSMEKYFDL